MEDLIKLVPVDAHEIMISMANLLKENPTPFYVSGDRWRDNPLACIRLLHVAKAWEIRIYGDGGFGTHDEFATLRIEYEEDDSMALLSAYNTFNSIHEVLSVTQLRNAGFVIQ